MTDRQVWGKVRVDAQKGEQVCYLTLGRPLQVFVEGYVNLRARKFLQVPFDLLLNTPGWYAGRERMPRLSRRLRELWFGHHPVIEVVHHWERELVCVVIDENGIR
jgi:hypothetical protein